MLEVAQILGISMEGIMEDKRVCIRGMLVEEKGRVLNVRSRKKPKGTRELVNLASSVNYD